MDFSHAVRESAVLQVSGADRVDFLQGQLTQDVRGMAPGEVRPAAALTSKGRILYVARLLALEDRFLLLLPSSSRGPVQEHLKKYAAFQKVTLQDLSEELLRIGLYGSLAGWPERAPWRLLPGEGEFAGELLLPSAEREEALKALEATGSRTLDREAAERLRVEAGRPRFGQDFDGSHLPDEVGLVAAISTTKGCYVGQEIVARMRTYGRVNRRVVGFRFPDGIVPAGSVLKPPEGEPGKVEWGRVTSAVHSDRFGPIGLGFAFRDVPEGGRLVTIESPQRGAVVTALPFR
ncbi:MAG: folate-binding protein YgfZ [Thermoanaerobaculia bacterium]